MMRRVLLSAAVTLAAAACGSPPPPAAAPGADDAATLTSIEPPPVHALIGHRQTLGLSSEQITALDSIGQQLHTSNQAHMRLVSELRERFRGRIGRDPRTGEPLPGTEEGHAAMEEVRRNNRAAAEGVRALLTPEQQARTCDLFRDTDRRGSARQDRQPAPRGAAAQRLARERIWPWCGEDAGAAGTARPAR